MRFTQLNAASRIDDLHLPPSNRLEGLKHNRSGQWSIRINDQWRICFRFDNGNVFEVVMIDSGLPPIHPGEFLAETLNELGISQSQFAHAIGVSPMRVSHVINCARPVTAELALLFGRALGQSAQYWLNLQMAYDLKATEAAISEQLQSVTELVPA